LKQLWIPLGAVAVTGTLSGQAASTERGAEWLSAGRDLRNSRSQPGETLLNPGNVQSLVPAWVFETSGSVSATPAVEGGAIYFPDWGGRLYRLDAETGTEVWSRELSELTGVPKNIARVTPVVYGQKLILGDMGGVTGRAARVMAVDKANGQLLWMTQVDDHPAAVITQSPVAHAGRVYVGVSSVEEFYAGLKPDYSCCTFRGSVVALDAETGAILWRTLTVPDVAGFSGNAVWGSTPVVDLKRGSLYVTTGNNYSVPDDLEACVTEARRRERVDSSAVKQCIEQVAGNYFDSVLALDLETGALKWARSVVPFDAWTLSCIFGLVNPDNCPSPQGPDHDFGQGPALFEVPSPSGERRERLGAGQKSGYYWALDPDTGEVVWSTRVGPGGSLGGLQWGSAVDGTRIYTANANSARVRWELVENGKGTGRHTRRGFWSALDPATGEILWQTVDPNGRRLESPVSVANGVVFGGSMERKKDRPTMFALSAETGEVLWSFASGATVNSGPAVVDGSVYWGSGYPLVKGGSADNELYAFRLGRLGERSPPLP